MSDRPSSRAEAIDRVRELIKDIQFAMFTTITEDGQLHSRPMATQQSDFDGDLWFLTSRGSHKIHELQQHQNVNVAYSDPDKDNYVSVAGRAELLRDRKKIEELWNPMHKAWFPQGKDDPDIELIRVHVESAEYWHAPEGRMVQVIGFAKAALTGQRYEPGENTAVDLRESSTQKKEPAA